MNESPALRSAPAQKARPVPVSTATRRVCCVSNQSHRRSRAKCWSRGMAFSWLGLLRVTRRMCGLGKEIRVFGTGGGGVVMEGGSWVLGDMMTR